MKAREVAEKIWNDIDGRAGGDHWTGAIDDEVKEEVLETWSDLITKELESRDKRIERLREALGKLAKGNRYPATLKLCKDALAADDALNDSGDVE